MRFPGTLLLSAAAALSLAACEEDEKASPDEAYRAYYARVIAGRTFEEDLAYHSEARRGEVLAQLRSRAEQADRDLEQIKALYLGFTADLAKCGSLSLTEERIEDDRAHLVYAVTDTCTETGHGTLRIEMVDEDGWKIVSDELRIPTR